MLIGLIWTEWKEPEDFSQHAEQKCCPGIPKGEIIALDEDDAMAITARKLVAENPMFMEDRILNNTTDNIPKSNQTCLTTIGKSLRFARDIVYQKYTSHGRRRALTTEKDELNENTPNR